MPILGSCACGSTRFEVTAAPAELTRCTCSFCTKRGALWAYYAPDQFRLLTSRDEVATYNRRNPLNRHHFCAICGCGTFSETPDWSGDWQNDAAARRVSVNAWLFDDVDVPAMPVTVIDGKNLW